MTDSKFFDGLPKVVWSGVFPLMGVDMKCHVLDNGERIIEQDSVEAFFDATTSETRENIEGDLEKFGEFLAGKEPPHDRQRAAEAEKEK